MKRCNSVVALACLGLGVAPAGVHAAPANPVPAFPGAEGFGARATGGRGGEVYHVTNLNDSGPGSLRDAVSQDNRTIVFDVGGYIDLRTPLAVPRKNITIAGQTAPGDGIGLRGSQVSFSNGENIIVRHIRVRLGRHERQLDSIGIEKGKNMIFDHVSVAWGRDEVFSINNSEDITVQNSIIAEGLLTHSMGGLIQWNTITLHHNLYMSNNDRNPKAKGKIDFVNNVVYNWGADAFVAGDSAGRSDVNVVGNYFIAGPSSRRLDEPISRGNANFHMYMDGNYYDMNRNGVLDGKLLTRADVDDPVTWMEERYPYPPVRTESAPDAYKRVIATVGASLRRDAVDRRLIQHVEQQTGAIIRDPAEVGGFGTLSGGHATPGSDAVSGGTMGTMNAMSGMSETDRYRARWVYYNLDERQMKRYRAMGLSDREIRGAANIALRSGLDLGYVIRRLQTTGLPLASLAVESHVPASAVGADIPGMGQTSAEMFNTMMGGGGMSGMGTGMGTDTGTGSGFGTLSGGLVPTDTDRDGMPDAWERFYKLNPNDPGDRNGDFDGTGYTNLEKYINGRADGTYPGR